MSQPKKKNTLARTVIDLVLIVSIVFMVGKTMQPAMDSAQTEAELGYVRLEATKLFKALEKYHDRHRGYPNAYAAPAFDPSTLEPLRSTGYYKGGIVNVLQMGRLDGYDSPDDEGLNHEFWIEMTLARDPSVRLLVAKSDDAPLSGGEWSEGVFVYRDGELETR